MDYPFNFSKPQVFELKYYVYDGGLSPPPLQSAAEVHIWEANLATAAAHILNLAEVLSPEEVERCAQYCFQQGRDRCVSSRGILRLLLSSYLQRHPQSFNFVYGVHGKPALKQEELHFNLTHSGDRALYAFTLTHPVGIDLEQICSTRDYDKIAQRFFTPREQAWLFSHPPQQQPQHFFQLWTYKEAWVKARGESIFSALEQLEVLQHPHSSEPLPGLYALTAPIGYTAALAIMA